MTLWCRKTTDEAAYERYLREDSGKQASLRAGNRVLDRQLNDYVGRHPHHVRRLGNDSSTEAAYERYLRGDSNKRSSLRYGNRVLDRLLNDYVGRHPHHVRCLANDLPIYGDLLYGIAVKEATLFLQKRDMVVEEAIEYGLSLSIFDFVLRAYCAEVFQFLDHDKQASLLLADALLFQVSGQDASTVKEGDILGGRSHNIRGIQKFFLIKQMKRSQSFNPQGDLGSWLLGVETARILCGGPDLSVELQIAARSPLVRYDASATVKLLLYNEQPSTIKRIKLEEDYEKGLNNLTDIANYDQKGFQNYSTSSVVPKLVSTNIKINQQWGKRLKQ
jgi:hypothetical protein